METITVSRKETVEVSGQGATKQSAFSDAISKVQKKIMAGSEDVFLQITPLNIEILSAIKETYTEKFLFFFLPRKKVRYAVKVLIHVEITAVSMAKVTFVDIQKDTTKLEKKLKVMDYKGI
ncbi:DUF4312 family protein [Pseudolactococcus reticulitermitis]|uniref:Cytoplasmic protein n=1 Tax=Pseudolactococcus reticulitermitis TaxID=2025039 RepID=A0A224XDU9_9LACT|nr:DUF4312 family protein [Lactococcus reticulitermitis]GAX47761.1 hypothetical protein RsY01_1364 [Lactococcus reticulitermitis]